MATALAVLSDIQQYFEFPEKKNVNFIEIKLFFIMLS